MWKLEDLKQERRLSWREEIRRWAALFSSAVYHFLADEPTEPKPHEKKNWPLQKDRMHLLSLYLIIFLNILYTVLYCHVFSSGLELFGVSVALRQIVASLAVSPPGSLHPIWGGWWPSYPEAFAERTWSNWSNCQWQSVLGAWKCSTHRVEMYRLCWVLNVYLTELLWGQQGQQNNSVWHAASVEEKVAFVVSQSFLLVIALTIAMTPWLNPCDVSQDNGSWEFLSWMSMESCSLTCFWCSLSGFQHNILITK